MNGESRKRKCYQMKCSKVALFAKWLRELKKIWSILCVKFATQITFSIEKVFVSSMFKIILPIENGILSGWKYGINLRIIRQTNKNSHSWKMQKQSKLENEVNKPEKSNFLEIAFDYRRLQTCMPNAWWNAHEFSFYSNMQFHLTCLLAVLAPNSAHNFSFSYICL